ncbi:hypothetical protein HW537_06300 [Asaia siamensis]
MDIPFIDRMLNDAGEKIKPLDHGRWCIAFREHPVAKGTNASRLSFAHHDIDDMVIEQGRDVARTVRLAMGHALVMAAFYQSTERRLVEGRCVLELTQIDFSAFFSEPAASQC